MGWDVEFFASLLAAIFNMMNRSFVFHWQLVKFASSKTSALSSIAKPVEL